MSGSTMNPDPCFYSFRFVFFMKRIRTLERSGTPVAKWNGQKHSEGSRNEYLKMSWSEFSWVMISELENPYIHTNVAVCGESGWFFFF